MRVLLRLMTSLAAIACLSAAPSAGQSYSPLAPGPYPVGVTTTVLVDTSRTDSFTKQFRTLVTEIWYPATDDARSLPKNRYSDFFPATLSPQIEQALKLVYKKSSFEIDPIFWDNAVRDARVREGKFPLIIFSHGNGGTRYQNTFWCDYMASHGYIIASADHTGNARITILDGKVIPFQNSERQHSAEDRPKDMSFLIDAMTRWNNGADSRFSGRVDLNKIVAAGMSFGSYTAFRVVDSESRFKVVIGMSGARAEHTNLRIPALAMIGTEDRTIGPKGNAEVRSYIEKHQGPALLLELKNGGHYSFTDMFKINKLFGDGVGSGKRQGSNEPFDFTPMERTYEIINSISVAFCGVYIKEDKSYLPFLLENHWPEDLIWVVRGQEQASSQGK